MPARLAALTIAALPFLLCACAGRARLQPRAAEELARGWSYLAAGDSERAEVAFEHALEFHPDLAEALNGLGVVARTREDLAAARARFERAVRLAPALASAQARREHWPRARRELLHLLESEPLRAAAHHDLAFMDYSEGRFERAEAGYRRATELAPQSHERSEERRV